MWALGVMLHLATFACFPNGSHEVLPLLQEDYTAPPALDPTLATLLEKTLKVRASMTVCICDCQGLQWLLMVHPLQVSPQERWSASDVTNFLFEERTSALLGDFAKMRGIEFVRNTPDAFPSIVTSTSVLSASPLSSPLVRPPRSRLGL